MSHSLIIPLRLMESLIAGSIPITGSMVDPVLEKLLLAASGPGRPYNVSLLCSYLPIKVGPIAPRSQRHFTKSNKMEAFPFGSV